MELWIEKIRSIVVIANIIVYVTNQFCGKIAHAVGTIVVRLKFKLVNLMAKPGVFSNLHCAHGEGLEEAVCPRLSQKRRSLLQRGSDNWQ